MNENKGTIIVLPDEPSEPSALMQTLSLHYASQGYRLVPARSQSEVLSHVKNPQGRVVSIVADVKWNGLSEDPNEEETPDNDRYARILQFLNYAKKIRPDIETLLQAESGSINTRPVSARSAGDVFSAPKDPRHAALIHLLNERLEYYNRFVHRQIGAAQGKHVFMTGASGFLGGEILRQYLKFRPECHLWILSRKKGVVPGEDRILSKIPENAKDRVTVLEGELGTVLNTQDIILEDKTKIKKFINLDANSCLGLDNRENKINFRKFHEMLEVCDEIFHCASYLSFSQLPAERMKLLDINLMGTQRILNLVERFKKPLQVFNYIGTAFVHGIQSSPDVFYEDFLDVNGIPMRHVNPYEISKAKATTLVVKSGLPYRIFNPSIIGEDLDGFGSVSELGRHEITTETMLGIFDVLRLCKQRFQEKNPNEKFHIRIPGNPEGCLNILPRNKLVEMIMNISETTLSLNHAYNTVHPVDMPLKLALDTAAAILGISYEFADHIPKTPANIGEALFYRVVMPLYSGYLFKPPAKQDMSNVRKILGPGYVASIPSLDEKLLIAMFEHHLKNTSGL